MKAYLAWTSYAYAMGDSSVASMTMSVDELVRVDSYVELNRQKGLRIDQVAESVTFGRESREGSRTLVPTHETWRYRYIPIAKGAPSPVYTASYDATYTLVTTRGSSWLVGSVRAKALGEVK